MWLWHWVNAPLGSRASLSAELAAGRSAAVSSFSPHRLKATNVAGNLPLWITHNSVAKEHQAQNAW